MVEHKRYWIWYPGDFEWYHALKQNFSRVERGCAWPAFWKSEGFRHRVVFRRDYSVGETTSFRAIFSEGSVGYVQINDRKERPDVKITLTPGDYHISIHVGNISSLPAVYIEGNVISSDSGWMVDDYDREPVPAGFCEFFTDAERDPLEWEYTEVIYEPVGVEAVNGGTLYTFAEELTAALKVEGADTPMVYLGESRAEALDTENCYYHCRPDEESRRCPRQALRYAFLPECLPDQYTVYAIHQYIDIPVKASFHCQDEELNQIFAVAVRTHMLCSGIFFIDGIKRDKWIWGGDAFQSLFVNRYLTADPGIEQRTLLALSGNVPVTTHVNTIVDYTLLWILGVDEHVKTYGDQAFLKLVYPRMVSYIELCMKQREEHGFLVGREKDWIYIDWAEFDKSGPLCAEQMLFAQALRVMERYAPEGEKQSYAKEAEKLLKNIEKYYWDEEKRAYIDTFSSGLRNVTRHANIFAILFDIADEERKQCILENVLQNEAIPAITTPYFRFYELEALARLGHLEEILREIKGYWGGMIRQGAVTFWEEYDPNKPLEEQYEMYGDPFGKSLCHAWGASPAYLLARYFIGLRSDADSPDGYVVEPHEEFLGKFDCRFPVGDKVIRFTSD